MHTACLNVAQREALNEIANRDAEAEKFRSAMDFDKWASDRAEIFWITTQQKDYLLSIWNLITH